MYHFETNIIVTILYDIAQNLLLMLYIFPNFQILNGFGIELAFLRL